MNVTKVKQQQGWYMDKILSAVTMGVLGAKPRIGVCQTVRVKSTRRSQVYGNWNGVPLTGKAEGEEMTLTLHESARIINH